MYCIINLLQTRDVECIVLWITTNRGRGMHCIMNLVQTRNAFGVPEIESTCFPLVLKIVPNIFRLLKILFYYLLLYGKRGMSGSRETSCYHRPRPAWTWSEWMTNKSWYFTCIQWVSNHYKVLSDIHSIKDINSPILETVPLCVVTMHAWILIKSRISADIAYDKSILAYRLSVKFHRHANPELK